MPSAIEMDCSAARCGSTPRARPSWRRPSSHRPKLGGGRRVIQLTDQKLANPNPDFFSYTMSKHALAARCRCWRWRSAARATGSMASPPARSCPATTRARPRPSVATGSICLRRRTGAERDRRGVPVARRRLAGERRDAVRRQRPAPARPAARRDLPCPRGDRRVKRHALDHPAVALAQPRCAWSCCS